MKKIGVVGLGYVGLTLAVYLAKKGNTVRGVDISTEILESISNGKAHFFEDNFDQVLESQVATGALSASSDYKTLADCDYIVITLGTPLGEDGSVNLNPLQHATEQIMKVAKAGALIILRSTVKVGTTRSLVLPIINQYSTTPRLAYCPERTLEGKALEELSTLPQIVAGINQDSESLAEELFSALGNKVVKLSKVEEAELVKLVNNTERDLLFGFANEIALVCQLNNLDGHSVINAANLDYSRSNIKLPGPVGGPCLEKDPHILHESFEVLPSVSMFNASRQVNESMVRIALENAISSHFNSTDEIKKVAILGFAFKGRPATSDLRGSLVFEVIKAVLDTSPNATIYGFDHLADLSPVNVISCDTIEETVAGADLVIIQNNHIDFQKENWNQVSKLMKSRSLLFDFWNQIPRQELNAGVTYLAFGSSYVSN